MGIHSELLNGDGRICLSLFKPHLICLRNKSDWPPLPSRWHAWPQGWTQPGKHVPAAVTLISEFPSWACPPASTTATVKLQQRWVANYKVMGGLKLFLWYLSRNLLNTHVFGPHGWLSVIIPDGLSLLGQVSIAVVCWSSLFVWTWEAWKVCMCLQATVSLGCMFCICYPFSKGALEDVSMIHWPPRNKS